MERRPHTQAAVGAYDARWKRYTVGGGSVDSDGGGLRFVTRGTTKQQYTDAQIDDCQRLARRQFAWRPPLTLHVRARFSHPTGQLRGTAGFGFWNDPFAMIGRRAPALPRALWFFYASRPSDMALALEVPGAGWKAAALDAARLPALLLAPTVPLMVPLMNIDRLYRRLWPRVQRALAVGETLLDDMADMTVWHDYQLAWSERGARFLVDGRLALEVRPAPRGPLGFVMWLDNQYAIATPQGRFGWGLLETSGPQWMAVEDFSISSA